MLKRLKNLYWLLLINVISLVYTDTASGSSHSVAQVSTDLLQPIGLFTKTLYNICYIIGAMMLVGSIVQYRDHRNNPSQVPFSRPIILLLLGLLLILLPIIGQLSASSSYLK